ncbi:PIN domain-containing protein [Loktanella salsilacus]|uniref:PIN domain-containing protein n=1 Tax=Loktanella salsilacus TaxID=195913 RepID=UPI0037353D47
MIAIDTNVLVRFLTSDDATQAALATALIDTLTPQSPAFISREVMIETVWVLERAYGFDRMTIAQALDAVLEAEELAVENPDRVGLALSRYRHGGPGFADQMIALAGRDAGATTCYTFDRKAAALPESTLLS